MLNDIAKEYLSRLTDKDLSISLTGGYGAKKRNDVLFHIRQLAPMDPLAKDLIHDRKS